MRLTLSDRSGDVLWREEHHQYSFDPYLIGGLAERHGLEADLSPLNNTHAYRLHRSA